MPTPADASRPAPKAPPVPGSIQHRLSQSLTKTFTRQLCETPAGRAALLSQLANAEGGDGGELEVFEQLQAYVSDEKLKKMIRLHQEDELRHEQLFLERAEAQSAPIPVIPDRVKLLHKLDKRAGLFNRPVESDEDVLRLYVALLVIEERATAQFNLLMDSFAAAGDAETVAVLEQVAKDEVRHLKYCHAITKQYAKSEEERQAKIAEMRILEAECFVDNGSENMQWVMQQGYIKGWRAVMWKAIDSLRRGRGITAPTAFTEMKAQGLA